MLLYQNKNFHLFGFRPSQPHGAYSAYGITWRRRIDTEKNIWVINHIRLHYKAKPIPGGIGCYKYEWESYKSKGISALGGNRVSIKKFARFRIGFGGKKPIEID